MTAATTGRNSWAEGSYDAIAPHYLPMAARVVEGAPLDAGDAVLDVGCGTGNVTMTAARQGVSVTGLDVTPAMLEAARERATIAGFEDVAWKEGNAVDLPFEADTFDVTLSALGHMYADPPDAATRELVRVTRPCGHLGFTSWTPTSVYPGLAGVLLTYLDPTDLPEFTEPPFMWGDSGTVTDRLEPHATDITTERETLAYPTLSPSHFFEHTAATSGLFGDLWVKVDEADRGAAREQMVGVIADHFSDEANAVELEYLHTTATVE